MLALLYYSGFEIAALMPSFFCPDVLAGAPASVVPRKLLSLVQKFSGSPRLSIIMALAATSLLAASTANFSLDMLLKQDCELARTGILL